jgi:hypothetical protein
VPTTILLLCIECGQPGFPSRTSFNKANFPVRLVRFGIVGGFHVSRLLKSSKKDFLDTPWPIHFTHLLSPAIGLKNHSATRIAEILETVLRGRRS